MKKYKMLSLRLSLFAVNDIVKFSGVLSSLFSIAVYSGVFYFSMFLWCNRNNNTDEISVIFIVQVSHHLYEKQF